MEMEWRFRKTSRTNFRVVKLWKFGVLVFLSGLMLVLHTQSPRFYLHNQNNMFLNLDDCFWLENEKFEFIYLSIILFCFQFSFLHLTSQYNMPNT